jgi:hypothetical protein
VVIDETDPVVLASMGVNTTDTTTEGGDVCGTPPTPPTRTRGRRWTTRRGLGDHGGSRPGRRDARDHGGSRLGRRADNDDSDKELAEDDLFVDDLFVPDDDDDDSNDELAEDDLFVNKMGRKSST